MTDNSKVKIFDNLPLDMDVLNEAVTIQNRARKAGFDWKKREDVWSKVKEELEELLVEVRKLDNDKMEDEFGDFLFSIINAANLYGINPERALKRCNNKFKSRFGHIEDRTNESHRKIEELTVEEMSAYWNEAKAIERGQTK